jgi:hypothetical protein
MTGGNARICYAVDEGDDHVARHLSREAGQVAWDPYVLRTNTMKGMTRGGWVVVVLALLLLIGDRPGCGAAHLSLPPTRNVSGLWRTS